MPALQLTSRSSVFFLMATLLALAAIGGAWFSELQMGFVPCMLCLIERWPYYVGLPMAALTFVLKPRLRDGWGPACLVLALVFIVSSLLGVYHAGVEWKIFTAPDCGGRLPEAVPSLDDFRKSLSTARVVLCDEAPMRVLGLSFAGWNGVVSAVIALLYARAGRRAR